MGRGALPQNQGTHVFTGARAIFKFNDSVVGYASGVSGSEEITYEGVDTLDHLEVREHAPTAYRVTFSAQMFRTIAVGPSTDEDGPGSIKEQNIFPKFDDILRIQGVDALIQDKISGKILFLLQQVKTSSYNFNVGARSITGQNVSFVAIRAFDESELPTVSP
jgi:hypothetical protein